jgi:RNA polymerase sigma-70 factor (ECF subfamily)
VYDRNSHKVYAIAFWMTGNELAAEDLMAESFRSAFSESVVQTDDDIDRALVQQLRKAFQLPVFTLNCQPCNQVKNVRQNTLRVDLERAVIDLPATEKLIFIMHDVDRYDHDRIARLLGITERESRLGLHQARLRVRELLAS